MRLIPDSWGSAFLETGDDYAREPKGTADRNGDGKGDGGQFAKKAGVRSRPLGKKSTTLATARLILKALESRPTYERQVRVVSTASAKAGFNTVRVAATPAQLKSAVLAHPAHDGWRFLYIPPSVKKSTGQGQTRPFATVSATDQARRDPATILAIRED